MPLLQCCKCQSTHLKTLPAGHDSKFPWMLSHQCLTPGCEPLMFTCNGSCGIRKSHQVSEGRRPLLRHHRVYHKNNVVGLGTLEQPVADLHIQGLFEAHLAELAAEELPEAHVDDVDTAGEEDVVFDDIADNDTAEPDWEPGEYNQSLNTPGLDGDEFVVVEETDLRYDDCPHAMGQPETTSDTFKQHMVAGNALVAASLLVEEASFQAMNTRETLLPVSNIMLFLYLARLVFSSGLIQQGHLSQVLLILYPHLEKCQPDWGPIPCTVSGFRSCFLNVSNSNSFKSILPIPLPETLSDGHGYTPLREILSHAFMMEKFDPIAAQDKKLQSLASSCKFKAFIGTIL
jgi:hypothetical protein